MPLKRSDVPLISNIELDDVTMNLIKPFDYDSNGTEKFHPYLIPDDLPKEFNIGVIVGASGTGKSTLLNNFGKTQNINWHKNKSIASHFEDATIANEKLSAVGLMSVPDWVKPFDALSNGQKFRANMARSLKDNIVIDEFTSVIDRNVAKAASTSMSKYIRRNNIKNVVLATVHKDILNYIEPDWVIDTDRGQWATGRYLCRPKLVLTILPCTNEIWSHFAKHHYLSKEINKASHCYLAVWNKQLIGFISVLPLPSGTVKNAWREHRLVIHPDYQGFGFGPKLSEAVAQHYVDNGKRYYGKTSHPRLGFYRDKSSLWRPTSSNHSMKSAPNTNYVNWVTSENRHTFSHEYIG